MHRMKKSINAQGPSESRPVGEPEVHARTTFLCHQRRNIITNEDNQNLPMGYLK